MTGWGKLLRLSIEQASRHSDVSPVSRDVAYVAVP